MKNPKNNLTGTAENFMHAHYLCSRVCELDEKGGASLRDDLCGEDSLAIELMPYGLMLGVVIDAVWEERKEFPGVPAYEISDGWAGDWLYGYLSGPNELPAIEVWRTLCTNLVRAWCDKRVEKFMALPIKYQIRAVPEGGDWFVSEESKPTFPNGDLINVEVVSKLLEGTSIRLNDALNYLRNTPTGTQLINFSINEEVYWRTEDSGPFFYSKAGTTWKSNPNKKPSNAIEYQKLIKSKESIALVETPEEAEAFSTMCDPEVTQESVEIKPNREITEPVIAKSYSLLQYKDMNVEATDEQIAIRYDGLEIIINGGKVELLKVPGLTV